MTLPGAPPVTTITSKLEVRGGAEPQFAAWQAAFTRVLTGFAGFLSVEIISTFPGSPDWRIVQRFRSAGQLELWCRSAERTRLLAELTPLLAAGSSGLGDETAPDFHSLASVTEVIATEVKPGQEDAFLAWCEAIQAAQGRFPGYAGTYIQAPASREQPNWTTLVRFTTPERLDAWLTSPERQALLPRAEGLGTWRSRRLPSSFEGWFPSGPNQAAPPVWKQAALVLLVLYPVVMLEMRFLSPLLAGLPLALATFVGNAISVGLVSWPLMPMSVFCVGWWLQPVPVARTRSEILGLALIATLYAVEIFLFMRLP